MKGVKCLILDIKDILKISFLQRFQILDILYRKSNPARSGQPVFIRIRVRRSDARRRVCW
jgi:hypothetical protein